MRSLGLALPFGLFLLLSIMAAGFWYSLSPALSVEFNLAELSPRGPDGGYAMPASAVSPPPPPPPTAAISQSTSSTIQGAAFNVTYRRSGGGAATSCTLQRRPPGGSYTTIHNNSGGTSVVSQTLPTIGTWSYRARCAGPGGTSAWVSLNHSVTAAPPTANLLVRNTTTGSSWTGSDITIQAGNPGDQIQLQWSSTYATSCSGSNFSTSGATSGTLANVTEPVLGESKLYSVSCTGPGGTAFDSLSVFADGDPPTISCSPTVVRQGNSTTCSWNTNDALPGNCSVSGPGVNILPLTTTSGSESVTVSNESVFTIDCGISGDAETIIQVLPEIQET